MKKPNNHVTPSKGRRAMILLRPFLWRDKNEAGLCNSPTASQVQRIFKYYLVSQLLESFEIQHQIHSNYKSWSRFKSCLSRNCAISSIVYIISNHDFCETKKREKSLLLPCKNHVIVAIFGGYFSKDYAKKNCEQRKIDLQRKRLN